MVYGNITTKITYFGGNYTYRSPTALPRDQKIYFRGDQIGGCYPLFYKRYFNAQLNSSTNFKYPDKAWLGHLFNKKQLINRLVQQILNIFISKCLKYLLAYPKWWARKNFKMYHDDILHLFQFSFKRGNLENISTFEIRPQKYFLPFF